MHIRYQELTSLCYDFIGWNISHILTFVLVIGTSCWITCQVRKLPFRPVMVIISSTLFPSACWMHRVLSNGERTKSFGFIWMSCVSFHQAIWSRSRQEGVCSYLAICAGAWDWLEYLLKVGSGCITTPSRHMHHPPLFFVIWIKWLPYIPTRNWTVNPGSLLEMRYHPSVPLIGMFFILRQGMGVWYKWLQTLEKNCQVPQARPSPSFLSIGRMFSSAFEMIM